MCIGQEGGRIAVCHFAADFEQTDTHFIESNGERTTLIGRSDIKGDVFRLRLATGKRGIIHQRYILCSHGLGSFYLIGKFQGSIIRHIQGKAFAVFIHYQRIGGSRRGGGRSQLCSGIKVYHLEGGSYIGENILTIAHIVFQSNHIVVCQIQPIGVHFDGVAYLAAAGLEEHGRFIYHGGIKAVGASAGWQGITVAVPTS